MFYQVNQNFPAAVAEIEALAGIDAEFAVLLADFEELSAWLASNEKSASSNEGEIEKALGLLRELEAEIRQKLEEQHVISS